MQKNFKGQLPIDLDNKKKYFDLVYSIWNCAALKNYLEQLQMLQTTAPYGINIQTPLGLNTPMHFAVVYENVRGVSLLASNDEYNPQLVNYEGKTAMDYAMLIPHR